jgi:hypothetical protein
MEGVNFSISIVGLLCGGNVRQRAERLFAVKGKKLEDIPAKLLAKKRKADEAFR